MHEIIQETSYATYSDFFFFFLLHRTEQDTHAMALSLLYEAITKGLTGKRDFDAKIGLGLY